MRQPNNKAIALLIITNIFVCVLILMNSTGKPLKTNGVAYAQSFDDTEILQKAKEQEPQKEEILFKVEQVTDHSIETGTIPLYFSHADEHGTYFTYLETEQPKTWTTGYWYIDYGTLELANINPSLLTHNAEIQGVYYANDAKDDHFEIKEVVAMSKSYVNK